MVQFKKEKQGLLNEDDGLASKKFVGSLTLARRDMFL
jgi:hypothetical protein